MRWPDSPLLLAAFSALAIGTATGAQAQETISRTEIRTAPPQQTHERLRDVVWGAIEVTDFRRDEPATRPLDVLAFDTRPYLTRVRNLCSYDRLAVSFVPLDEGAEGPDAQVVARQFLASSWWSFVEPPQFGQAWQSEEPQAADLCSDLPEDQHFYRAPDLGTAAQAYLAMIGLKQDIAAGRQFKLACESASAAEADCREEIADLPVESLQSVDPCNAHLADGCYHLDFGERHITVEYGAGMHGADPHVTSATLERFIILFHPRPD
ncbi:hypothetical protein GCM10009127_10980 [Alteraurantiacibacter aestuarii]|uniref:Uncharacterized protein n=1 Tax=Alteraurantiacibacter aestuarii TaxID=650004 RepID=A0A844ZK18_9SPHN|nr:hypothetical protein [Alteraurantiacibacter aestuarii]MXO87486.1 hypothetical protein [Alteraurantiacibacter aestuarii]